MKKLLSVLLAGIMVASLAACGGGGGDSAGGSTGTNEPLKEDAKAELSYVSWNTNQEEQNRATIDAFNKKYPNIKVNLSFSTWSEYWNKLEAAATGGNLSDLITMHTNTIAMYVNNGYLADLTDLNKMDPDFSYDKHPDDVKKLYSFNDKMWSVPKDFDCIIIVYNKKLFDAAGVSYPTDDWTWEDTEAAAKKITDKDKGIYGFGMQNSEQDGWGSFLYQNGGGILSEDGTKAMVDDPKSIEAMEWVINMYNNYSPTTAQYTESDSQTLFAAGNLAMQTTGNWNLNYYTDNEELDGTWDITALPHPANGEKATLMNGLALSVSAKSKNIDAAKQFAAYFGTEQGQMDAAMGPSIPCYDGVSEKWAELNKDKFNTNAVISQMQYGKQWVGTESKTQWDAELMKNADKIFNGEVTVEEGFKAAAAAMNPILEKEAAAAKK